MSGLLMEREGVGWRITRPRVYIRTLGWTMVYVDGELQKLAGNGAGQHQLRRELSLFVGCCDRPVSRQALRGVAGIQQRPEPHVNPFYMVNGLVQMLRRWKLSDALVVTRSQLTLLPHPSWGTDTDELAALVAAAETSVQTGDSASAIAALELAVPHCGTSTATATWPNCSTYCRQPTRFMAVPPTGAARSVASSTASPGSALSRVPGSAAPRPLMWRGSP